MFFNFALFATLACHSLALPNHTKRQGSIIANQWTDIVTFLDSEENPATNANYTCTDRCAAWNNVTMYTEVANAATSPGQSFCSPGIQWSMLDCTECVGGYFMQHLAQTNPLGNLGLIQKFMLDQANCTVLQTTPTYHNDPTASISSASGIQTSPTSVTDTPSPTSNATSIQTESSDSPAPTDGDTTSSSATDTGMPDSATDTTSDTTPEATTSIYDTGNSTTTL